jgi:hypothetical protein
MRRALVLRVWQIIREPATVMPMQSRLRCDVRLPTLSGAGEMRELRLLF